MKRHYVYKLVNGLGIVEYVGETINPKRRFDQHTKCKPSDNHSHGKFYNREDITLFEIANFELRKDALALEGVLKRHYGLEWTERTRASDLSREVHSNAGKKGGKKNIDTGHIQELGKKNGAKNGKNLRKLTFDQAEEIRQLNATKGYSKYKLSEIYNVSPSNIHGIIKNKTYTEP